MKDFLTVFTTGDEKTVLECRGKQLAEIDLHEDDARFMIEDILKVINVVNGFSQDVQVSIEENDAEEKVIDLQIWGKESRNVLSVASFCISDYEDFEIRDSERDVVIPNERLGGIVCGGSVITHGVDIKYLRGNRYKLNSLFSAMNPLNHDFIDVTMTNLQSGDLHIEWMDRRTGNPKGEITLKDYKDVVFTKINFSFVVPAEESQDYLDRLSEDATEYGEFTLELNEAALTEDEEKKFEEYKNS